LNDSKELGRVVSGVAFSPPSVDAGRTELAVVEEEVLDGG
jgi:hypothetical protein